METLVKGQSSLYFKEQLDEETYAAPTSGADAVQPNADSVEFTLERETIERNVWTDTIESVEQRSGKKSVTGSVAFELKAGTVAGEPPRGAIAYESLFGGKHQLTEEITTLSGHTSTLIVVSEEDLAKFKVNSVITIKEAGAFEMRPIKALISNDPLFQVELAIPLKNGAPSNGVKIEKNTTYFHDKNSKAFAATHFIGGGIKEMATGLKVASASIEGWTANQVPSINFSLVGLNLTREVGEPTPDIKPDFSNDPMAPVLMHACAYLGQEELDYTEISLSVENTSVDLESACSPTGKIGTRKTAFNTTSSINPYMSADSVAKWEMFENEQKTSKLFSASNPSNVEGEFSNGIAVWLPNVKITNMPSGDNEGVLTDNIELQAFRKLGNDTIFMSFN